MIPGFQFRFLSGSFLLHLMPALRLFSLSNNQAVRYSTGQSRTELLRLLKLSQNIEHLKHVKSLFIVHGVMEDEFMVGEFLRLCFDLGSPELAVATFQATDSTPGVFLQNLMIRCLSNHGFYGNLLTVYKRCQELGCCSDNFTFPFVIKACAALLALPTGKEIHCVVLRKGFEHNLVIQTTLIDMYAKTGHIDSSRLLLDRIPQPDLVSCNALISGYSLNGLPQEAFAVFQRLRMMGLKPNASTFASIIPICNRLGRSLNIGRSLHGFSVKSGCFSNETLVPALISMYACGGDLSVAIRLFDCLPEKNIVTWNAMISGYTQNRKSAEAFELFRLMLRGSIRPNAVTFVSIIPSCDSPCDIRYGESIHAHGIKDRLDHQISVVTALVSMYAKVEDLDSAKFLFDRMPEKTLLTWNSMVSGYVQNGFWDLGLDAFRKMQFAGFAPDGISIISILSACSRLEDILLGKSAHSFILRKGFDILDLNVSNALLAFYSDCYQITSSLKLFHRMPEKNVVSWNTLISGCVRNGDNGNAIAFLHQMQQEDVKFDLVTLISVLPSFCDTGNLLQGMIVHTHAIKIAYCSDITLVNALISMYVNCGDLDSGLLLFEVMPERSVISWNALITGYRCHNLQEEVMELFRRMMMEDHEKPNYVTLLNITSVCLTQLQGKSIHAYAVRTGIVLKSSPLLTSLMIMYSRFENLSSCFLLFEMEDKGNISLWNTVMSVHIQMKNAKKAIVSFNELLQMKVEPDHVTVLSLISACVQLSSSLDLSHSVMACIICRGFEKDILVSNALIDLYARCGEIAIARKLFDGLIEKDTVSWSVMINGYGLHGDGKAVLHLFSKMKVSGVRFDGITFVSILSACSHAGLVDQGRMVFRSMEEEHGILPRMEHYACMVDLLGRAGHLNEAFELIKRLPSKPSASLLESLLGACSIHGNIELGEEIGRLIFEMNPENSGSYVMLSNMYAAAGRWIDAGRVRSDMEGRRLRKVPGFSFLEVN